VGQESNQGIEHVQNDEGEYCVGNDTEITLCNTRNCPGKHYFIQLNDIFLSLAMISKFHKDCKV
jgi:hypothetical protein